MFESQNSKTESFVFAVFFLLISVKNVTLVFGVLNLKFIPRNWEISVFASDIPNL